MYGVRLQSISIDKVFFQRSFNDSLNIMNFMLGNVREESWIRSKHLDRVSVVCVLDARNVLAGMSTAR